MRACVCVRACVCACVRVCVCACVQVHDLVRPRKESIEAINSFLLSHGITPQSLTPNSDVIQARVSIAQAEKLLATRYHVMHHAETGYNVTRTNEYSLPQDVAAHVDFVCPTVHIPPAPKKVAPTQASKKPFEGANTPPHLRELYSVDTVGKFAGNKMAVTAFLNQHYSHGDLTEFWKMFCTGDMVCGKGLPTVKGDGSLGFGAGIESMLDIESITGIAGQRRWQELAIGHARQVCVHGIRRV